MIGALLLSIAGCVGDGRSEGHALEYSAEEKLLCAIPEGLSLRWVGVMNGGREVVLARVVNETKGDVFDHVRDPIFSRDGKVVAYKAEQDGKWSIVVGGKKGPAFEYVGTPVLSGDGSKVAYAARRAGKVFVVVADWKSEKFDSVGPFDDLPSEVGLTFVASDAKVAFLLLKGREIWWKVIDGD